MNFEEFLMATGKEMLLNKIKECYSKMEAMPSFAHEQALTLYKQYLCVGGMPEAVNTFLEKLDIIFVLGLFTSNEYEDIETLIEMGYEENDESLIFEIEETERTEYEKKYRALLAEYDVDEPRAAAAVSAFVKKLEDNQFLA